ncbi:MAG: arsenic transporter, partial [Candidatus Binataceae bacterium]
MSSIVITGIVAALATAGVIIRPLGLPQAVWAVAGAALLIPLHLLSPGDALAGVSRGVDVYLFLAGMMLLSEIAREEGLFAWLAAIATRRSRGSATRLFLLIYAVGVIVTTFLSNDATAVVLTPAVAAAARSAKAEQPLPYLLICAFIANAASFVLPISNPANLVIYGAHVPPLLQWLPRYLLPSGLSIAATYAVLRWTQRGALKQKVDTEITVPILSLAGKTAALGLAVTAIALLAASALDVRLGLPTAVAGALTALVVLIRERKSPWQAIKGVSWGVLPLVAGLFVLVEALEKAGLIRVLSTLLQAQAARSAAWLALGVGIFVACVSNLINNLPMGLIAGSAVHGAHVSDLITRAVLIGVDLGPNLSVTGSLATILW